MIRRLIILLLVVGCWRKPQIIHLSPIAGDKASATITMSYTYAGVLSNLDIQWDDALKKATEKCQNWGYKEAEIFGEGVETCLDKMCGVIQVEVVYQCHYHK